MIVRQIDLAEWLAAATGSSVEEAKVKISQWIKAGHLAEGEGLVMRDGVPHIDCTPSAPHWLLRRLDAGQGQGNAQATIRALRALALWPGAVTDGETAAADADPAEDHHARRTMAQADLLEQQAIRRRLDNEHARGALVDTAAAQAAMVEVLSAELADQERWLADVATEIAAALGGSADRAAIWQVLRDSNNKRRASLNVAGERLAADAMRAHTGTAAAVDPAVTHGMEGTA